jgi:hypothetical protein
MNARPDARIARFFAYCPNEVKALRERYARISVRELEKVAWFDG